MKSITFRTQFIMNTLTIVIVGLIVFVSTTFASTPQPNGGAGASNQPAVSLNQQTASEYTTVSYQGHLTDADGEPVTANSLSMTFRLYTTPKGGTPVWEEERSGSNGVPVKEGLFNVMLGSVQKLGTDVLMQELWLGISVGGDSEMTPRERLSRMPTLFPDGSVTSDKLALQHGTACLPKGLDMDLLGTDEKKDIPGLKLNFTLDKPASVMIWIDGYASFNQKVNAPGHYISLNLDDVGQTDMFDTTNWWYKISGQRIVKLESGSHTLKATAYSVEPGTLEMNGSRGFQTCINYLVLGQQ